MLADSGLVVEPGTSADGTHGDTDPGSRAGTGPRAGAGDAVANIPLTIGGVSRLLGVAASTLRTWDRRYDLGPSERTDGQHRRYTQVDVARLALVRQLTLRGAQLAEAARAALATPASALTVRSGQGPGSEAGGRPDPTAGEPGADGDGPDGAQTGGAQTGDQQTDGAETDLSGPDRAGWPPRPGGHQRTDSQLTLVPELTQLTELPDAGFAETGFGSPPAEVAARSRTAPPAVPGMVPGDLLDDPDRDGAAPGRGGLRRRSTGRAAPLRLGRVSAQARGLARAAVAMDAPLMTEVLTDGVQRLGVVPTWDSVVSPVLVAVGRRWELSGDGIEVEHLLTETVMAVMSHRAAVLAAPPSNTRPVLLAATAAEMHVLSLYAIAAAMAERRVSARVLGARVPGRALAAAVARVVPSAVFLFAQSPVTARVDLADLLGSEPTPGLVVGGPGWDAAALPEGALHAGSLARAVDLLCALAV